MDNYQDFESKDFVIDDFFRQWVLAPTPAAELFWQNWQLENPDKVTLIQEARQVVQALRVKHSPLNEEVIASAIQETASQFTDAKVISLPTSNWASQNWLKVAAAVVLLLISSIWVYNRLSSVNAPIYKTQVLAATNNLIERVNETDKPIKIRLSDSSVVTLQQGSKISYNPVFKGANREVYLSGEAFFEIAKDPKKPFLVYANELVTKVLGTSFRIKAYPSAPNVSVEVATGRVSVFTALDPDMEEKVTNRELDGIVLTPNQRVVFSRQEVRLAKFIVEKPAIVKPEGVTETVALPSFEFADAPISEVFTALEKSYNIDIIYDEELMQNCPLTASLSNEDFFEKLTIICKAIEARYEVLDGQIVIYGKGCKE